MFLKNFKYEHVFYILFILVSIFSLKQCSNIALLNNTYLFYVVSTLFVFALWKYERLVSLSQSGIKKWLWYSYFFWMWICIIRGGFSAENYWDWKYFYPTSLMLLLPLSIKFFSNPYFTGECLRIWLKICIPIFFVLIWFISPGSYHFYLSFIFIFTILYPLIPSLKWKIIILFFGGLMLFSDIGARSQIIKQIMAFCLLGMYYMRHFFPLVMFSILRKVFLWGAVLFLILGMNGTFNIFRMDEYAGEIGDLTNNSFRDRSGITITADTRTGLYEEIMKSALKHDYVLWGRTPARGNDTELFWLQLENGLVRSERHANEFCHPNIFTWTGLIGMTLYSLFYWQSSYLALARSKNVWIKLLGVCVVIRWAYGWVEDVPGVNIQTLSIWMMIGMCYSPEFRQMTNMQFAEWVKTIFLPKRN